MPDPVQNALAAQPSNNLAYIGPTPRNRFLGGIADFLGQAYSLPNMPRMGVPGLDFMAANRNRLLDMLGVGDVQKTAEALSYGNRIGTGAGMTYQPLPETLGAAMTVAPMVAPAARMAGQGAMATGRFVAPKAGQLAEQYMVRTGGILPLDVYHGTPHTLPPTPRNPLGEFDASKIGTGEGAQAYGHGIYTAENPAVATGYKEKLSQNRLFDSTGAPFDVQANLSNPNVRAVLNKTNGDIEAAIARAKQSIESIPGTQGAEYAAKDIETLNAIKVSGGLQKQSGNLYKIDLPDEKIAKMLDWDKPLNEQPEILAAIKRAGYKPNPEMKAGDFIAATSREGFAPYLSDDLVKQGIPGIQYLDQSSRFAGAGTRNFVVFPGEEKNMTILERNGQPAQMSVADQIDNINETLKKKRKK